EGIKEDITHYYKGIIFSDIICPEWKNHLLWYSPETYHATIKALTLKLLGEGHYFTHLIQILPYEIIEDAANYAFTLTIEGHIPKNYH
ncbi:MAG: hypothetical protein GXN99_02400, partial [Candidatus Nanohaloarchaeota archaeon]|nr:hypothetical protein [Candidatus Nanohaloarchaeota archaeon]